MAHYLFEWVITVVMAPVLLFQNGHAPSQRDIDRLAHVKPCMNVSKSIQVILPLRFLFPGLFHYDTPSSRTPI
jgi:hypothetical protein